MIFETPHVLSSYSNVFIDIDETWISLHTFTLDPSLSTWEKILVSECTRTIAFISWLVSEWGVEMLFKRSVIGKKFHISHKNFVTIFVCCEKFAWICLPLARTDHPLYIKTMVYISNPRNHDLKLDFFCVRGILNWLVCRASEQTYVSILHP